MSKTYRQFVVSLTTYSEEHLPDDMDDDAVTGELRDVVQEAVERWYAERGHDLVVCEPIVG